MFGYKAWGFYSDYVPRELFTFHNGTVPVFDLITIFITGMSSLIAGFAQWGRKPWAAGWSMFTLGLLLYANINSMGKALFNQPILALPMVFIVLVVLQSFPYLIRQTHR